jgi:type IV pilus assembly protein PilF
MLLKSMPLALFCVLFFVNAAICIAKEPAASTSIAAKQAPLSYRGKNAIALAQKLINRGDYAAAMKQAEIAIKSDPKAGAPHMVKAYIFDQQKQSKKAGNEYARALTLSPNNGFILNAYAVHLCENAQYDQADAYFIKAIADSDFPSQSEALENASQCSLKNSNFTLAEYRARLALSLNPESVSALEVMAQVKFKQLLFLEARAFMQRREALGPLSIPLVQLAHQIEKSAGDDRAAAQYLKQLELLLQAQIQPPTGEGQKKP